MRVKDIMHREVVTVDEDRTCADAAKLLREHQISALVVNSATGGPAGIITERDYVNLVADRGHDGSPGKCGCRRPRAVTVVPGSSKFALPRGAAARQQPPT